MVGYNNFTENGMSKNSDVKHVLISVSNKLGIVDFARTISRKNMKIIATSGTAKLLINAGIPTIKISSYTGFSEIMDGRLKTLNYKIFAGILARQECDEEILSKYNINKIDIVVVNLYPFAETISNNNCSLNQAVDNIDIGGTALIRAAAKNYNNVTVIVDINDYSNIIKELENNHNSLSIRTKFKLAIKAFEYTAKYDDLIHRYLYNINNDIKKQSPDFPKTLNLNFFNKKKLTYGENFHQNAAFYTEEHDTSNLFAKNIIKYNRLSYNNIIDSDTAINCINQFNEPTCVIVKHANPCGVAIGDNILDAYLHAYQTDPISAFGGVIAINRILDLATAKAICKKFVEIIIAPSISESALSIINKKSKIRLLILDFHKKINNSHLDFKKINGGLLVQDYDSKIINLKECDIVSKRHPTQQELDDAIFSWKVVKFIKSNAIVYARRGKTLGIGAGQTSRVYSVKIANLKAMDLGLNLKGATLSSDAFFPFRDSIDIAAQVGISCVIQPGGSVRDNEVINAVNEHSMSMIFTKIRNFRH